MQRTHMSWRSRGAAKVRPIHMEPIQGSQCRPLMALRVTSMLPTRLDSRQGCAGCKEVYKTAWRLYHEAFHEISSSAHLLLFASLLSVVCQRGSGGRELRTCLAMQAVIIDDKNSRVNYTSGWYNADGHSTDFNQYCSRLLSIAQSANGFMPGPLRFLEFRIQAFTSRLTVRIF